MVVAFAPGGRPTPWRGSLPIKLGEKFGQRVIVENRPGAGGNIGYEFRVAEVPARRSTRSPLSTPSLTVNPSLYTTGEIRCRARLHPHLARGPRTDRDDRAGGATMPRPSARLHRARAPQARQDDLRLRRQRHAAASQRRILQGVARCSTSFTCRTKVPPPPMIDLVAGRIQRCSCNIGSAKAQIEARRLCAAWLSAARRGLDASERADIPRGRRAVAGARSRGRGGASPRRPACRADVDAEAQRARCRARSPIPICARSSRSSMSIRLRALRRSSRRSSSSKRKSGPM